MPVPSGSEHLAFPLPSGEPNAKERYGPLWTMGQPPNKWAPNGPPNATYDWLDANRPGEQHGLGGDCISPFCNAQWSPAVHQEMEQYGSTICPNCGLEQNIIGQMGGRPSQQAYDRALRTRNIGPRAGISLNEMGNIGEEVVKRARMLPCGPIVQDLNAIMVSPPVDFQCGSQGRYWGVEVKANHSLAAPRFKLSGSPAKKQRKIQFCQERGWRQGFCGVRLNFYTSKADIFFREGFTDTWLGADMMQYVGEFDFADLNPFRDFNGQTNVPDNLPDEASAPDYDDLDALFGPAA